MDSALRYTAALRHTEGAAGHPAPGLRDVGASRGAAGRILGRARLSTQRKVRSMAAAATSVGFSGASPSLLRWAVSTARGGTAGRSSGGATSPQHSNPTPTGVPVNVPAPSALPGFVRGNPFSYAAAPKLGHPERLKRAIATVMDDPSGKEEPPKPPSRRDIGVYMAASVLRHKCRDGHMRDGKICYWRFNCPENVGPGSKLWVASDGRWQGYFVVAGHMPGYEVTFHSEWWKPIKGLPKRMPFQGFTYSVPDPRRPSPGSSA